MTKQNTGKSLLELLELHHYMNSVKDGLLFK